MNNIFQPSTREEIQQCFDAFKALRPHLIDKSSFVEQIVRQQEQAYQIVAVKEDGRVVSAAGFRFAEFLAWGKVLYLDDLTTLPEARGYGHAGKLLDWLIEYGKQKQCKELHLDTGYGRHQAHKLYLSKDLELNSHHMSIELI
ncbi:MAG: GNAT family N-acetyltransferase [Cellvibrionaceae bacterium]